MSWRCLEDFLARRLEDVLKTYGQNECIGLDQDVLKTSWRRLLKTNVFKTYSSRRMFAGNLIFCKKSYFSTKINFLLFYESTSFTILEQLLATVKKLMWTMKHQRNGWYTRNTSLGCQVNSTNKSYLHQFIIFKFYMCDTINKDKVVSWVFGIKPECIWKHFCSFSYLKWNWIVATIIVDIRVRIPIYWKRVFL